MGLESRRQAQGLQLARGCRGGMTPAGTNPFSWRVVSGVARTPALATTGQLRARTRCRGVPVCHCCRCLLPAWQLFPTLWGRTVPDTQGSAALIHLQC